MKVRLIHSAADPVRLAFPSLLVKRPGMQNDDGSKSKDKYEATLIVQKGGKNEQALKDAIVAVAKEKYGEDMVKGPNDTQIPKWRAIMSQFEDGQKGLRSGDRKVNDAGEIWSGFEGRLYVVARNENQPGVYDIHNNKVTEGGAPGSPYGGCYVHAEVDVWALNKPKVTKRIVTDLLGVRKAADGDAFGAGSAPSKSDSFADLAVENDDTSVGEGETGSTSGDSADGLFD